MDRTRDLRRPLGHRATNREFVFATSLVRALFLSLVLPPLSGSRRRSTRYPRRLRCRGIYVRCTYEMHIDVPPCGGCLTMLRGSGKVDRLKSIMLGDYREEPALVTVQLDL